MGDAMVGSSPREPVIPRDITLAPENGHEVLNGEHAVVREPKDRNLFVAKEHRDAQLRSELLEATDVDGEAGCYGGHERTFRVVGAMRTGPVSRSLAKRADAVPAPRRKRGRGPGCQGR